MLQLVGHAVALVNGLPKILPLIDLQTHAAAAPFCPLNLPFIYLPRHLPSPAGPS